MKLIWGIDSFFGDIFLCFVFGGIFSVSGCTASPAAQRLLYRFVPFRWNRKRPSVPYLVPFLRLDLFLCSR